MHATRRAAYLLLISSWFGAGPCINGQQQVNPSQPSVAAASSGLAFAVTRIKPSPDSEADDWGIGLRGRNFWAVHVTLVELIAWAYGINVRQVEHGPAWLTTERFDVDGVPDQDAHPTSDQYRSMLKSCLAERFALTFHSSEKVLPVYVLSIAGGGIAIKPSQNQEVKGSWGVHRGWLSITNMKFDEIAHVMQRTVFDRPVLDRTALQQKYSFVLKWRPDETEFSQMQGMSVPEEQDTSDLQDIFVSAREQLGIQITAKKIAVPSMSIERVTRPSSN